MGLRADGGQELSFPEWLLVKLMHTEHGLARLVVIQPRRARGLNYRAVPLGHLDLDLCHLPRLRLVK